MIQTFWNVSSLGDFTNTYRDAQSAMQINKFKVWGSLVKIKVTWEETQNVKIFKILLENLDIIVLGMWLSDRALALHAKDTGFDPQHHTDTKEKI